jgi:hypothetical protein
MRPARGFGGTILKQSDCRQLHGPLAEIDRILRDTVFIAWRSKTDR